MKIAAISDLHGHLSHSIPECDVLVIAGDIVPLLSTAENWKQAQELHWWETKFVRWLRRNIRDSRARATFVVAGNHDILLNSHETREEARAVVEALPGVRVLGGQWCAVHADFEGVRFAGYPYTPTIQQRTWAFSQARTSPAVPLALGQLPTNTDVLISHGPPQGILDTVDRGHVGCANLMKWMIDHGPALTICGHVHERRGKRARYFDGRGVIRRIGNVSICDENYSPKGAKVQVFEL